MLFWRPEALTHPRFMTETKRHWLVLFLAATVLTVGPGIGRAAAQDLDIPSLEFPDLDKGGLGADDLEGEDFEGEDLDGMPRLPADEREGPPPRSTEESKQDRLGQPAEEPAPLTPADRSKRLEQLYDRLGAASDSKAAEPVVKAIQDAWNHSGSETVDLLISRAAQFAKETDFDLAMEILDATVEIAPESAEAWHQRAVIYFMRQDYQNALADLRRALSRDERHFEALNNLGVVFETMGEKKAALQAYRKALKVNPFLDTTRESEENLSREVEGQGI